jgi:rare lipoprotein A
MPPDFFQAHGGNMRLAHSIAVIGLSVSAGLAQAQPAAATQASTTGVCSYYARAHDGKTTAGGEKFDSNAMTAAHRRFPMGTKLKVTNLANGKSVVVKVNDRGPFVKGRTLSVTRRAAEELGFVKQGVAKVRFEPVQ